MERIGVDRKWLGTLVAFVLSVLGLFIIVSGRVAWADTSHARSIDNAKALPVASNANPEGEQLEQLQRCLSNVLHAIASPTTFDNVFELLDKQTRTRIGNLRHQKYRALENAQKRFQQNWKRKYGSKFSFGQGYGVGGEGKQTAIFNYQYNASPDLKQVSVHLSPQAKPPRGALLLVHEKFDKKLLLEGWARAQWRISVPETVTGIELREAILQKLAALNAKVDQWPEHELPAYIFAARELLSVFEQIS